MESQSKRTKPKRNDHEKLRAALEGKTSGLDALELEEEDDVYDIVSEEVYAAIVESRRKGLDFVVDDEGLGYYDDGEEHLGVGEDAYEKKKRIINESTGDADNKMAKKARLLAEAGAAQKNSMMNFVRTGQVPRPALPKTQQVSEEAALDIDSLLEDRSTALKSQQGISSLRPAARMARRPATAPVRVSTAYQHSHRESDEQPGEQYGAAEVDFGNEDGGYLHDDAPQEFEIKEEPKTVATEQEVQPELQQRNLSKTTKKLKLTEPSARASAAQATFKPALEDFDGSSNGLGLSQIGGLGAGAGSASQSAEQSSINPKLWLQHRGEQTTASPDGAKSEGQEFMNMFWLDACENQGVIYLFGKVGLNEEGKPTRYVSCCVAVHNAERNLFILPSKIGDLKQANGSPVRAGLAETYQEVSKLLVPNIVPKAQGQSFRCKSVKRKYAFEHGEVPREETEYLKVVYSAKHGVPSPAQCQGNGSKIERIFGATSSPLELFLLKRGLMGPCWITVNNPRTVTESVTWCKVEVGVENPKFISKIAANEAPISPPLVSMCVSMKTVLNPSTHLHEIVALTGLVHTNVNMDADSELNPKFMRRFTYIRPLGLTCGPNYPANFPHDLSTEIKKLNSGDTVQTFPNERALLSSFFARVQMEDPDVFASHNLFGFEFDVLLARSIANKVPTWSKLGRLRKSRTPKSIMERDVSAGRILCDTYKAAKEFLRETTYSLKYLAGSQLSIERVEVDPVDVPKYFTNTYDILRLAHHTALDAYIVQRLICKLQIIPLTKQLTNLSGNLWSRTVRGARAERIEYLLLHEFHSLKYILPERKSFDQPGTQRKGNAEDMDDAEEGRGVGGTARVRAKAAYAGGLVLEPKKGLYDTFILLLDFNSLYPSLIQEYNLCFTTIDWTKFMKDEKPAPPAIKSEPVGKKGKKPKAEAAATVVVGEEEHGEGDSDGEGEDVDQGTEGMKELPPLPDTTLPPGVLPRVIKTLVDRRKAVKQMLKKERDPLICQQLDIRQKALKLTANSMYGCLGFAFSRFYARPIAALVTSMGREALQRTVDQATNQFGLEVIYGDTDSVMINTNSTDLASVRLMGENVKREVNKLYKSLELDIDGIFKSMLLLKKKKYAAVSISEVDGKIVLTNELKGLDLVRRDWCPLSKNAGKYVVEQILSGKPRDEIVLAIHEYLSELAKRVRDGEEELASFVVTKGLNKNPRDYPDCKGQPHLQVALAMVQANKPVNIGDHIPYVICQQGPEGAEATARAHHPDDILRSNGALTVDVEWYLTNQILPPIARLCDPIEGTSQLTLSQCLGLDTSKFISRGTNDLEGGDDWGFTPKCKMDDSERFKDCTRLTCVCSSCKEEAEFPGVFTTMGTSGLVCGACGAMYFGRRNSADCYSYLSNRTTLLVRQCIRRYYDCWLVCDDPTCARRSMQQPLAGLLCTEDCHGHLVQEYNEESLHTQMKYIEALFDFPRGVKRRLEAQLAADGQSKELAGLPQMQQQLALSIPNDHQEVFRLLRQHMSNSVNASAYNWIRPSLWTAVFGRILKNES